MWCSLCDPNLRLCWGLHTDTVLRKTSFSHYWKHNLYSWDSNSLLLLHFRGQAGSEKWGSWSEMVLVIICSTLCQGVLIMQFFYQVSVFVLFFLFLFITHLLGTEQSIYPLRICVYVIHLQCCLLNDFLLSHYFGIPCLTGTPSWCSRWNLVVLPWFRSSQVNMWPTFSLCRGSTTLQMCTGSPTLLSDAPGSQALWESMRRCR